MKAASRISALLAGIAMVATASAAKADEITVGYFLEWPMPFQFAKVEGLYDEALGMKVNWKSFDAGTAMSAAMASGDVQISVSQSAKELEGKKAGVPIGTAAHYGFLKQMAHFGVDVSTMEVVDMSPPDGAAAFAQGSLDMVCSWGGSLRRMKEHGNVLLTGAEKDAIGISVYDVTSVPASFAAENADVLAKFLKVTADMNAKWLTDSAEMLPVIAKDAGMSEADAADTLKGFQFPTVEAQLSDKWLGKATPEFLKGVGDFFKEQGNIPESRDTYDGAVNTGPLAAAAKM